VVAEVGIVLGAGVAGRVDCRQATRTHLRTVVEKRGTHVGYRLRAGTRPTGAVVHRRRAGSGPTGDRRARRDHRNEPRPLGNLVHLARIGRGRPRLHRTRLNGFRWTGVVRRPDRRHRVRPFGRLAAGSSRRSSSLEEAGSFAGLRRARFGGAFEPALPEGPAGHRPATGAAVPRHVARDGAAGQVGVSARVAAGPIGCVPVPGSRSTGGPIDSSLTTRSSPADGRRSGVSITMRLVARSSFVGC
jgi:hypothetical protein